MAAAPGAVTLGAPSPTPNQEATVPTLRAAAEAFLAQPRIAVAGVSRDPKQPANLIYRRLRDAGHTVFPVNPHADETEGAPCFASVRDVPGPVDGVVVVTPPDQAERVVEDSAAVG